VIAVALAGCTADGTSTEASSETGAPEGEREVRPAAVGDEYSGTIASEVTTEATGGDGVRHSKDSDWSVFTVPTNCAIDPQRTVVEVLSENGSEHSYELQYDDYVVIVPGTQIKMPRTIRAKTHARSPTGFFSGRGWEQIRVTFTYVQFTG
jgi:predicted RNA-binding protein with TRAM domain